MPGMGIPLIALKRPMQRDETFREKYSSKSRPMTFGISRVGKRLSRE
jgi:hypothetical protein